MWKVKGCPRCGGDILVYKYHDIKYESCLQCGYTHELLIKSDVLQKIDIKEESGTSV